MPWVFGYASLLPAGLTGLAPDVVPCRLTGWHRSWGVAMDNTRDLPGYKHYLAEDGSRPPVAVAFLDIALRNGASVNGAALPVDAAELPGLDARERNYHRVDITDDLDVRLDGRVWTYVGLQASRDRAAAGLREGRMVVARSYYDRVVQGFELLGQLEQFFGLTAPLPVPLATLEMVQHAARAEPRSARSCPVDVKPPAQSGVLSNVPYKPSRQ